MIGYVLIGTFPWYVMECKLSHTNYPRIHEISPLKFVISKLGQGSKRKRNIHIPKVCTPPPPLPPSICFSDGNFVSKKKRLLISTNSLYLRRQGNFSLPEI